MATEIMNILGGKMIIFKDKLGTVCWTAQAISEILHILKIREIIVLRHNSYTFNI